MTLTKQEIQNHAYSLGFDLIGFTEATPHPHFSFFKEWIQEGKHAGMNWLANNIERRQDPQNLLKGARTIISLGLNYYRGKPFSIHSKKPGHAWISSYAWGDDYHKLMEKKLKALVTFIEEKSPQSHFKACVDTSALLERSYAEQAGLGWIGKNTCLINPRKGSFFFIGEILTDLFFEGDNPEPDHCGKCTRCLDACPTQALTAYELDARKCIAYWTIEHRGEIDAEIQSKMDHHLFGCDICQEVCPWNQKIPLSSKEAFEPRPGFFHPAIDQWVTLSEKDFSEVFKNSPIKRTKWEGFKRNLRAVKNNEKN